MRRALIGCCFVVMLVVPTGALAGKPADKVNAAKECKAERGHDSATQEAFKAKYGKGKNGYGKCVSQRTRENAAERKSAHVSASKACRAERKEIGDDSFKEKYGTNRNGKNAFGKCVSSNAPGQYKPAVPKSHGHSPSGS